MAIEFDCPYCTATIRVPDAFGGKQGRCPKCDTHLIVPLVVRPGQETVPDVAAPRSGAVIPGAATDQNGATEEFPINPVSPARPTIRRRRPRRRTSRALVIGMPVLGFLVLMAIIGYSLTGSLPLSGEFLAKPLADASLPRVTIPWSDTGLSPEDQKVLQEFLRTTPETLASQIMTCRLIGADEGIEVQLTAGPENEWYAVNPGSSKSLALWLKKERSALSLRRLNTMKTSLTDYCRDKLAQIAGEPIAIDAISVRDNVGLTACGGPFSFVIEAVAGSRIVQCAYEDSNGIIYFCLPRGTTSFKILGRTFPDSSKLFAGEFTAVVTPDSSAAPPKSADGGTKDKSDMSTKVPAMPESEMPDDDKSMSEEMEPDDAGGMMKSKKSEPNM